MFWSVQFYFTLVEATVVVVVDCFLFSFFAVVDFVVVFIVVVAHGFVVVNVICVALLVVTDHIIFICDQ